MWSKSKKEGSEPVSNQEKRTSKEGKSIKEEFESGVDFTIAVLERDEDEQYGCVGWAPRWLQFCRREPAALLTVLCIMELGASYLQHGVMPAVSTQLQRRFQLSSVDLAWFRSVFDIGAFACLLPIILFGEDDLHRAQWIGFGGMLTGVGGLMMIMPHFVLDLYKGAAASRGTCPLLSHREECDENLPMYKYVFMAGEFIIGIGSIPQHIMGVTFLDENVTHRQSSIYTAVFTMCQLAGTIVSFLVSRFTLELPGDLEKEIGSWELYYKENKEDFYGAWWLSVLIGVMISWTGAALIFPFPKRLSGSNVAHIRDSREAVFAQQSRFEAKSAGELTFGKKIRNILANPVYVGVVIEQCFRSFLIGGFVTFLPKYLEAAFDVDATHASLMTGATIVSMALLGLVLGTVIQHLFRLEILGNLRLCLIAAVCSLIFSGVFAVKCDSAKLIGLEKAYESILNTSSGNTSQLSLNHWCNAKCNCQEKLFNPVCFRPTRDETYTYFSMCHAGCHHTALNEKNETLGIECNCLPKEANVTVGRCFSCYNRMGAFLTGLSWVALMLYMRSNPLQQVLLRCVGFKVRTTALAIAALLGRSIAYIPAPLVFAALMRSSCKIKSVHCGKEGRCAYFDHEALSMALVSIMIGLGFVCMFALMFSLLMYRASYGGSKTEEMMDAFIKSEIVKQPEDDDDDKESPPAKAPKKSSSPYVKLE